ncbi:MAG TPA: hypothetical protein VJ548_15125 [Azospira sp.]|nr:hypothetical protein [Azospira sp.]
MMEWLWLLQLTSFALFGAFVFRRVRRRTLAVSACAALATLLQLVFGRKVGNFSPLITVLAGFVAAVPSAVLGRVLVQSKPIGTATIKQKWNTEPDTRTPTQSP